MIRRANGNDSEKLTGLSITSKMHWNYSGEDMDIFRTELNIDSDYIHNNEVWVLEDREGLVGYYSYKFRDNELNYKGFVLKQGYWLDHMFIAPIHMGQGYGRLLFKDLQIRLAQNEISELMILVDPNSKGFYEKMGCNYIREYPSSIPGRTIPYFVFHP